MRRYVISSHAAGKSCLGHDDDAVDMEDPALLLAHRASPSGNETLLPGFAAAPIRLAQSGSGGPWPVTAERSAVG